MRSALLCVLVLALCSLAQAQTTAVQPGFAIVTVESGNAAGIAPVETLIHDDFGVTTTSDLSPTPLLTNSAMVVYLGTAAAGTTGIAVMNPTTATAHVQLLITNAQGGPILNQTLSIVPRGQFSRFVSELFAGQITSTTPPAGLLTITADAPVGVVALNFRGDGFSSSPLSSLASPMPLSAATFTPQINNALPTNPVTPVMTTVTAATVQTNTATNTIGGGASFLFPQVVTGGGWATQITIANNSAAVQVLRIDFFDPNGNALQTINGITIPPLGLFSTVR
jgi:hypothetical protein